MRHERTDEGEDQVAVPPRQGHVDPESPAARAAQRILERKREGSVPKENPTGKTCSVCRESGHNARSCPKNQTGAVREKKPAKKAKAPKRPMTAAAGGATMVPIAPGGRARGYDLAIAALTQERDELTALIDQLQARQSAPT